MEKARKTLKRALELDKEWRHSFKGLSPEELHILCAVVSVAAWELRGNVSRVGEIRESEIIAAYICKCRGIEDYPLAGLRSSE